ncbi:hypothetical protein OHR68_41980 [Spirillospora sp. NBC_00431]
MTVVAVVVVIGVVAALIARRMQRRNELRGRFGPEYDRMVKKRGGRRAAERELHERQERVERLNIRPLAPAARDAYRAEWTGVQERFVDAPEDALSDADQLVRRVMADRGYETRGYQQRVADLSVEHARTLEHYRTAHDISDRAARREASTEELRQAMIHYRALFDELLADTTEGAQNAAESRTEAAAARDTVRSDPFNTPRRG